MNYVREALAIMKSRWVEVSFLLAFRILTSFYSAMVNVFEDSLTKTLVVLSGLSSVLLLIAYMTFDIGFLRTVYTNGEERMKLSALGKTGMHFLGRVFSSWLLLMMLYGVFFLLIRGILKPLLAGYLPYPLVRQISQAIALVFIMKPLLIVPSVVLVKDCGIFKGFKVFRYYRLLGAKGLVPLLGFAIVIPVVWVAMGGPYGEKTFQEQALTLQRDKGSRN